MSGQERLIGTSWSHGKAYILTQHRHLEREKKIWTIMRYQRRYVFDILTREERGEKRGERGE